MDYVKGCDISVLSKSILKRIADGRIVIADGLIDVLNYDVLSGMLAEAKIDFVNGNGKTIKDLPSGEIFVMTKKIDKVKTIIGLSFIKRIAGAPSDKKGIDAWFEESRDKKIEDRRFFAEGFEKEMEYFDQSMISHFKDSVGWGQIGEAEYQDKIVSRGPGKKVLGVVISHTLFFLLMIIIWGLIFKNLAIGICFALCFAGSFAVVTNKTKAEEKTLADAETN
ncbi:MAG: hypothetical protein IKG01_04760 [Lachnospiraceae bacterium]|nr:hypothetical protein [Lachnospiraceae bacterium]